MFDSHKILITGGTGSWGQTLTRKLLREYDPSQIIIFSRGEYNQVMMQRKFKDPRLKYVIGDVRDYDAVYRATKGVAYVFHLAALKHVPLCEENVEEAIKTNIDGTLNVIKASIENGVSKVIDVSTDKAAEPVNLYGMTKAVGEKAIIAANSEYTKFVCIRGGNVMGSNGSVIPLWIDQIKSRGLIDLTDSRMTRFFMTLEEAIGLVFKAAMCSVGGELFVMNMPSYRMKDVAEVLIEHYDPSCCIAEIGLREGEKLHETLLTSYEAVNSYFYEKDYFVALPINPSKKLLTLYESRGAFTHSEFTSNTFTLSKEECKKVLQRGGFLK